MTAPRRILLVLLLAGGAPAQARNARQTVVEEPRLLTLRPARSALLLDYESHHVETRNEDGRHNVDDTWSIQPGVQLGLAGSVYHSSLLTFDLIGEFSREHREYDYDGYSGSAGGREGVDKNTLQRYDARATLLRLKPYAVELQAARQEFDRHLDFFTREEVDSTRWAVSGGYRTIPRELSFQYSDSDEDVTGEREYTRQEKSLKVVAARRLGDGEDTELQYNFRDLLHLQDERTLQDGQINELRLRDHRRLSMEKDARLSSSASYNDQDTTATPTQRFYWNEKLNLQHRDSLSSSYQYRLNRRTTDQTESMSHFGQAIVRHQLYQSLSSSADVQGNYSSLDGEDSDTDMGQVGAGVDEVYTKHLRESALLNLGASMHLRQTQSDNGGAGEESALEIVQDESVLLSNKRPTTLSRPDVDEASIRVTDSSGGRVYQEGIDYRVVTRGGFTEIQRIIGGAIPEGSTVLVDYSGRNQPSDGFWTSESVYSIRLTLFEDRLLLHARQEDLQNHGSESSLFPTYSRTVYGAEAGPGWSKTGVEVDDNNSSDFPYHSLRVYEDMTFSLPLASTLVLDLSNTWRDYEETGEEEETLSLIGHLRSQMTSSLSLGLSAGYLKEQRPEETRNRTTYQADAAYRYGKLDVSTGYDYNADHLDVEDRDEHRIWLRSKRWF